MESSDEEFGDLNFVSTAARKNQQIYKSVKPIRRETKLDSSSSDFEKEEVVLETPEKPIKQSKRSRKSVRKKRGRRCKKTSEESEEESSLVLISSEENSSEDIVDLEKDEIFVKVRWKYEIKRIPILKTSLLGTLFDRFAEEVILPVNEISFTLESDENSQKPLTRDFPADKLSVTSILRATYSPYSLSNLLELKIQSKDSRNLFVTKIKRNDKLKVLAEMYKEFVGDESWDFQFIFDGEVLDLDETPDSLDLEGGECVDAFEIGPQKGGRRS